MPLPNGTVLENRYELVRLIKFGGFGEVYEAKHRNLNKVLAVKRTLANTEAQRRALKREARFLAHLSHVRLPKVTDHFDNEHGHFLVMDFIDGEDLGEIVEQKVLPVDRVLRWAHQLLDVVEYLHGFRYEGEVRPIVHCDIKPSNLKLNGEDEIILLDFGLASGLPSTLMSTVASVQGATRAYAPLEQIHCTQSDEANPQWDIYALGATLYHLVTGFAPTPAEMRAFRLNKQKPDPLETAHKRNAKKIPLALSDAIAKAMEMDADDRYATIGEFRAALVAAVSSLPAPAVMVSPPSSAIVIPQLKPSFRNSIGMEFVLVPAGKFQMGSNEYDDEKPIHEVTIATPFYLGKYQVTQGEWAAVMGSNPSHFKGDDRLPVESVSWDECQKFIRRLNARKDGYVYGLPSEAEWEYACRAGTTGDYAGELDEMGWYMENSGGTTHAVGEKKPNAWGLHDMHGNVREWCQDRYHENYDGAPSDGRVREQGSDNERVLRGGSWDGLAYSCRSADRSYLPPGGRGYVIGCRLVAARVF
jgi:formylglycine-generating enzyme required for sulfatase activity/tRNA A-37 threonylcarbamoyl transferase component Bud32